MNTFDKIEKLRKEKNIKQNDLTEHLGLKKGIYTDWKIGRTKSYQKFLPEIADFFGVSVDYLLSKEHPAHRVARLPVLGNVAAGVPIEAITDIDDFEEIDLNEYPAGEYVALRVKGHSMEPRLLEGDVVIVRIQDTIEDGEVAIVMVGNDEATCKKIKKTPEGVTLISTNPIYEPMFYTNKEVEDLPVRIFGRVVEYRCKI